MNTSSLLTRTIPPSRIKPQLSNLSGSGNRLAGVIVERDLENPLSETDTKPGASPRHVLVVPSRTSARLEWTASGHRRQSLYTPNDLIINPAGYMAAPRWDTPIELLLFAIEPQHLATMAEEAGTKPQLELEMKFRFEDKLLEQLVRTLVRQFEADVPADLLYAESLTQTLLLHLVRTHTNASIPSRRLPSSATEPRVKRAIEFIQAHLSKTLSVAQIAREADLNTSRFSHVFKQTTGLSPHQYVLRERIERAMILLKETRLQVSEIASRTGFADQSHLTRLMKQVRGITPAQARKDRY